MFCPICGAEVDKLIEYEGSKVCPKCGCVVEKNEKAAAAVNEITLSKKMSAARIIAVAGIIFSVLSVFIEDFSSVEFLLYLLPVILIDVLCIIGYKFKSGKIFNITVVSVLGVLSLLSLVPAILRLKKWSSEIGLFVDYLLYPKQSDFLVSIYCVPLLISGICFVLIALFMLSRKKAVGSVSVAVVTLFGICFLIHDIRCAIIYGQFELSRLYYCSLPCMTMIYSIFLYVLDRMEIEKQGEDESKAAEPAEINQKKIMVVALCTAVVVIAEIGISIAYKPVKLSLNYKNAVAMFDSGNYDEASSLFEELGNYKDSADKVIECGKEKEYKAAEVLLDSGDYENAITAFEALGSYSDSADRIKECYYALGSNALEELEYNAAISYFEKVSDYSDASENIKECYYALGSNALDELKYNIAISNFKKASDYSDSSEKIKECYYEQGISYFDHKHYDLAIENFDKSEHFKDSDEKKAQAKEEIYKSGQNEFKSKKYASAIRKFKSISGYKDADEMVAKCKDAEKKEILDLFKNKKYSESFDYFKTSYLSSDSSFSDFLSDNGYKKEITEFINDLKKYEGVYHDVVDLEIDVNINTMQFTVYHGVSYTFDYKWELGGSTYKKSQSEFIIDVNKGTVIEVYTYSSGKVDKDTYKK